MLADRPYVVAAALNAVLYLYVPMLSVLLPLYIARATTAPAWSIGAIFVLNTTGVALLQVRAARRVIDLGTAVVAIRSAGAALLLACLAFALAAHTTSLYAAAGVLAAAVVLQILGEVLLASGSWEIGFALADPDHPGQWQGLFSSGIPLARAIGPIALTGLVLTWTGPGWLILGLLFAGTALFMGPVVAWGTRTHTVSSAPAASTTAPGTKSARTPRRSARPSRRNQHNSRRDEQPMNEQNPTAVRLDFDELAPRFSAAMARLDSVAGVDLDPQLRELVRIHASTINGCAYCVDMHTKDARAAGVSEQRITGLGVWRETDWYTPAEQSALALTEAITLVADGHVPRDIYDEAARHYQPEELAQLVALLVAVNAWNRIGVTTRCWEPGSYQIEDPP